MSLYVCVLVVFKIYTLVFVMQMLQYFNLIQFFLNNIIHVFFIIFFIYIGFFFTM